MLHEIGQSRCDLITKYGLTVFDSSKCRQDALEVLFQNISFRSDMQRADDVFIIREDGQEKDFCPGMPVQCLRTRFQTGHTVHTDIQKEDIGGQRVI